MRWNLAALCGAALSMMLCSPNSARADLIHWEYAWTNSPTQVMADAPGTGYLTLTNESLKDATGSSDIVATNIKAFSTASPNNPDTFTNKAYTLSLTLVDVASGQSGTLQFSGVFNGTLTAYSALITNTFEGTLKQTLLLGDNLYTATLGSYTPPGPPDSTNSGTISMHTDVLLSIVHLPEPTSMALLGIGAGAIAVARLRRRRISNIS